MWQDIKETCGGLFVAALQLTSKPMPRRRQCLGCLRGHHSGGVYCAACEAGLVIVETVKAALVMAAGAVLVALVWWVL